MRVLFLDVDGVLNSEINFFIKPNHQDNFWVEDRVFSKSSLELVSKLIYLFDLTVILSSSWRHGWGYQEDAEQRILQKALASFNMEVYDVTPTLSWHNPRGEEIQAWLDENQDKKIEAIIIIDDETDMLHLKKYLIKTDPYVGFSLTDFENACSFLLKQLDN